MRSLGRKIVAMMICLMTFVSLLSRPGIANAADKKTYNAVLSLSSGCYYPGYNAEFKHGTPGRLDNGAQLYVEKYVTNANGVKVAVAYSYDLERTVYVSARFVKEVPIVTAPLGDGLYTISPKCAPGRVIDVVDRGTKNETPIQIWEAWETAGTNQMFYVKHIGEGLYTFESSHAEDMMLDVAWGYDKSGGTVHLYAANNTPAQSFYLEEVGDGSYYIVSALNKNLVLDVQGGGNTNGLRIQTYNRNNTSAQKFRFTKVVDEETFKYNNATYEVLEGINDYTYNQMNYSRYVEKGKNVGCTAVALATAYSIKNPEKAITPNSKSIQWIAGTGVVWTTHCKVLYETRNLVQQKRFEKVYDYIMEDDTPVIIRLDKINSTSGHSVTVVGIKEGAKRSSLTAADLLVVDPAGGVVCSLADSMKKNDGYKVSNTWSLIIPK